MQTDPLLSVSDLQIAFRTGEGEATAVKGISFSVGPGETLAIVGESGSGKSVSAMAMMQLLPRKTAIIRSGKITFNTNPELKRHQLDPGTPNSLSLLELREEEMRSLRGNALAMIFQEPMTSLNPLMTCGEQVSEMLSEHLHFHDDECRRKTIALFEEVKLPRPEQIYSSYPHQLSGGQRQRVMIAMAISCEPSILIADEPTTALDVTVQKSILDLLKSLQQRYQMALIFITHDLGIVTDIADYVVVMRQGEVVESGPATDVLKHPRHLYTRSLLACIPVAGEKKERLLTVSDFQTGESPVPPPHIPLPTAHVTPEVLIDIRHLTKTYASVRGLLGKKASPVYAVNDVSFSLFQGETLGLVGESGCGKTTLSRLLLGLIPATSGEIVHHGNDLLKSGHAAWKTLRKDFQIIFQDPYSSLNPRMSIGDCLTEPMMVHALHGGAKQRRKKALDLMEKVGLPATAFDRYPHEFSGGQRQRIVIARALAVEPKFIICDEAVSALDVSVQAQVLNLLNDLKHEYGLTYIFISHNLGVVYHMSDRILVMNKGRIEECGTAWQVYHQPASEYTRLLIASMPGQAHAS